MQAIKKYWQLIFIVATGLYLTLYISPIEQQHSRLFEEAWNLGHIILFFFISLSIIHLQHRHLSNWTKEFIAAVLLPTLLGIAIELIQPLYGRTFQIDDIIKNCTGSLLAFAWLAYHRKNKKFIHLPLKLLSAIVLFLILKPFAITIYDNHRASNQFPVLSNFESPSEITRFSSIGPRTKVSIQKPLTLNKLALFITVDKDSYAGISMDQLIKDWSNYQRLKLSIYQTTTETQHITLRIHDAAHINNGFEYNDRFNHSFVINTGWNHLDIAIKDVEGAPANREINLKAITNLSLFLIKPKPQTLWLSHIELY